MSGSLFHAIQKASAHRHPLVLRTPLQRSEALSRLLDCDVLLKAEHLQTTGSFKFRGASNKIRLLSSDARRRGVVTASTGNHGHAVALASRDAGVPATVYAARKTSPSKLSAIAAQGADLRVIDGPELEAELTARAEAQRSGRVYISPYNDAEVVAGQGTLGLELAEAEVPLDAVFVSVGGGGLIGGIGTALANLSPSTQVVGCWPENSPVLLRALEAGVIHDVPESDTISDGTAGALEPDTVTLPICSRVIGSRVTVSEDQIRSAMWALAEHEHWMVEGAAGVALAGLAALREEMRGRTVAVVLCGRNIQADTFASALGGLSVAAVSNVFISAPRRIHPPALN